MTAGYLQDYEMFSRNGGTRAPWLTGLRQAGLDGFQGAGFPTSRDEDWRFNNLAPLTGRQFRLAAQDVSGVTAEQVAPYLFAIPGVRTLVFVNGRYAPGLSAPGELPAGATVRNLAGALGAEPATVERHLGRYANPTAGGFTALNTAFVRDGLYVHIGPGVDAGAPIHAVFVSDGRAEGAVTYPRNLLVVEQGGRAAVLESYVGLAGGTYFTNAVTEAAVGDGAYLDQGHRGCLSGPGSGGQSHGGAECFSRA